ncbi:MAG: GNAT family N-acetyltransferase [Candidatus Hodarchaeales archaeon]
MLPNTVLRKARLDDYPEVKKLSRSVWSNDYLVDFYEEIITDKNSNFFILETDQKEIIGCINAETVDFAPENIGYIKTLRVKDGYQGHGIGTYLTTKMLEFFKTSTDVTEVYYVSGLSNSKSVRVALKNGFKEVCIWPAAVIDVEKARQFVSGINVQNQECSNKEILKFLSKENIQLFNCHWEFYPLSLQLIDELRSHEVSKFILSHKNNFLSYYSIYDKRNRLVANFVGKPSSEALKELLGIALSDPAIEELTEIRVFVQEKQQKGFSNIPLMDFSQGKGVRLFVKKLKKD